MQEQLLHFIWQYRYFNHRELTTQAGETLYIYHPGFPNADQGPDFQGARISIGGIPRTGAIELHVRSSDWRRHQHDEDPHYSHVILHVVWENDCAATPAGIPIVVLQDRTPKMLLARYQDWMAHQRFIPCEPLISIHAAAPTQAAVSRVNSNLHRQTQKNKKHLPPAPAEKHSNIHAGQGLFSHSWCHQLVLQRLDRRADLIRDCLAANRDDWELTTWWFIARSLGQPVNTDVFFAIARSLPLKLLLRHRGDMPILQALLFGQAGLLEGPRADPRLKSDYDCYRSAYQLRPPGLPVSFLRMRPAHHPTHHLTQLAGLLGRPPGWFTLLRESADRRQVIAELMTPEKPMGDTIKKSVLLNALVPVLYAFGVVRQEPAAKNKALRWLYETPAERNSILGKWQQVGVHAGNAAEGQALLELKKNYCSRKRCLECAVGRSLLTRDGNQPEDYDPSATGAAIRRARFSNETLL